MGSEVWYKFTGSPLANPVLRNATQAARSFTKERPAIIPTEDVVEVVEYEVEADQKSEDLKATVHRLIQGNKATNAPDGEHWNRSEFIRFFRCLDPVFSPEDVDVMLEAAFPGSKNESVEFFLDRFIDWVQGSSNHHTSRRASQISAEHMVR